MRALFRLILGVCLVFPAALWSQSRFPKERTAVFTVVVTDANGREHVANGFFIDENGTALSSYKPFENAEKAEVRLTDGRVYAVTRLVGVDFIEYLVRFQIDKLDDQPLPYLTPNSSKPKANDSVYVVTDVSDVLRSVVLGAKVTSVDASEGFEDVFKFQSRTLAGLTGAPVLNRSGEVIGVCNHGYTNTEANRENLVLYNRASSALAIDRFLELKGKAIVLKKPTPKVNTQQAIATPAPAKEPEVVIPPNYRQSVIFTNDLEKEYPQLLNDAAKRLKEFPDSAENYNRLGLLYLLQEPPDVYRALQMFNKAIKVDYRNINSYINRSIGKFYNSDIDGALNDCALAIDIDPRNVRAMLNQGIFYFILREYDQARSHIEKALKLDPDYPDAHFFLGMTLIRTKGASMGCQSLKRAEELGYGKYNKRLFQFMEKYCKR